MAFSMEFITHGGFEIVKDAWNFVSIIMQSSAYRSAITAFFLLTIVFSAIGGSLQGFSRANSMYGWLKSAIIAILMYAAFFQTGFGSWNLSGKLVVYDDIKNKNYIINNLPVGLVAIAGTFNKVQVGMEDLVKSVILGPYTNDTTEVVTGVKMLREAASGRLKAILYSIVPEEVKRSIYQYISQVASVEATAKPSVKAIIEHSDNLIDALGNAANPALYTMTWLDANGNPLANSEVVTGDKAWDRIKKYLNKNTSSCSNCLTNVIQKFCQQFGFETTGDSYVNCRQILQNVGSSFLVPGTTSTLNPESLAGNIFLKAQWDDYVRTLDSSIAISSVLSTLKTQSSLTSTGIMAAQWIPHIKNVLTAILIGMTPIIMLLIATSFSMRAITVLFGLFAWLTIWSVMDKILEGFWIKYAQDIWNATAGFGVKDQELFWANASQTLAVLGGMRSSGMMLAGVVTYGIFQFGGSMFAHMVFGITGSMNADAAAAGTSLHPSHMIDESLAKSAASAYQWSGMSNTMRSADWYGLGRASGIKNIATAEQYKEISQAQAKSIGRQQFENIWAKTTADSSLGMSEKMRAAMNTVQRGFSKAQTTERAMERYELDHTQAQRLLSGEITLGDLSEEAQKKILGDVFGKSFSQYLDNNPEALKAFSGLKFNGVPGQVGWLNGVVGKEGLQVLANYAQDIGKTNVAESLRHFKGENATLNAIGGVNFGGLSKLGIEEGAKTELYDFAHAKQMSNVEAQRDKMKVQLGPGKSLDLQDVNYQQLGNKSVITGFDPTNGKYVTIEGQGKISRSGQLASFSDGQYKMSAFDHVENTWGNINFKPLGFYGFGSMSREGDYYKFNGMFDKVNGQKIVEALKTQNHINAAQGLEDILNKQGAVKGILISDAKGKILGLQAGNQTFIDNKDLHSNTTGKKDWTGKLSTYEYGSKSWMGNVQQRDYGYKVTEDSMRKFALAQDSRNEVVQTLSNDALQFKQIAFDEQARAFSKLFSSVYQHKGSSRGSTDFYGKLEGGIIKGSGKTSKFNLFDFLTDKFFDVKFIGGATAGGMISHDNSETTTKDFLVWGMHQIQKESIAESMKKDGTIDKEKFAQIYQSKTHQFYQEIMNAVNGESPAEYGKSMLFGLLQKYLTNSAKTPSIKDIGDEVLEHGLVSKRNNKK